MPTFTIPQRAEQIYKSTKEQLIILSHEIEYVDACEKEIQQWELLKKCVKDVQAWQDKFVAMSL